MSLIGECDQLDQATQFRRMARSMSASSTDGSACMRTISSGILLSLDLACLLRAMKPAHGGSLEKLVSLLQYSQQRDSLRTKELPMLHNQLIETWSGERTPGPLDQGLNRIRISPSNTIRT
jgi:hypothetical protein